MIRALLVVALVWLNQVAAAEEPSEAIRLTFERPAPHARSLVPAVATVRSDSRTTQLAIGDSANSAQLTVTLLSTDSPSTDHSVTGDRIEITEGAIRHLVYRKSESELEWEIVLSEPVLPERLVFAIALDDADCLYQPLLTEAEIREGVQRPDSVVGSYAVYSRSSGRKLFHLYRPRAWDMAGDTVWCELVIDTTAEQLEIILPSAFVARAAYPLTIDPTVGFTTCGASSAPVVGTVCYANKIDGHTASSGDVITQFHGWFRGVGEGALDMAIYSITDGTPDQRLAAAVTMPIANSSLAEINSSSVFAQPLSPGQTYAIAFGGEVGDVRYSYDSQLAGTSIHTASSVLPSVWTEGAVSDRRISLFVTYETGGTAPLFMSRRRASMYHWR